MKDSENPAATNVISSEIVIQFSLWNRDTCCKRFETIIQFNSVTPTCGVYYEMYKCRHLVMQHCLMIRVSSNRLVNPILLVYLYRDFFLLSIKALHRVNLPHLL